MAFLSNASTNETVYHLNAPVSTTANATAQSLSAYTLPAGAFKRLGQSLRIKVFGTVGTNGNTKTLALRFGGTALNASATGSTSNGAWEMTAYVVPTALAAGASTATATCSGYAFAAALAPTNTALSNDLTLAVVIDMLCTNGSASADCTVNGMIVEGLSD